MNVQVWWFLARAAGLVATGALTFSVLAGLLLAGRLAGRRPGPAWVLDLHRGVSATAVVLVLVHVAALMLDSYVAFSWADVLVPMASDWKPVPVALGVVAAWFLVAVQGSSLVKSVRVRGRRLSHKLWRRIHWLSLPAWALVVAHLLTAGTDADLASVVALTAGAIGAVVYVAIVRAIDRPKRRPAPARRPEPRDA